MTGKLVLVLFAAVLLNTGCSSGSSAESEDAQGVPKEATADSSVETIPAGEADEEPNAENVFLRYDAVKKVLHEWNEAVKRHRTIDMEKLYADKVMYYSKETDKQSVFNQKNEWFKKHLSYSQELGYHEVYYDDSDTLGLEFIASFTKICIENNKRTEVESFLYFRKFGNDWKIVKETDALTEVNAAKKKPLTSLPEGSYEYYQGYWSDTRDIPQFAHDMAPYNTSLNFTISGKGITGVYNEYSGTARSRTFYLVKSGKITNGILELQMVYSESDDPAPEDLEGNEETETWRFKILPDKKLLCISKENVSLYSRTLRPLK